MRVALLVLVACLLPLALARIELCADVFVDETGVVPVGSAFSECLAKAARRQEDLSVPAGIYSINETIVNRDTVVMKTPGVSARCDPSDWESIPGAAPRCATLRAHASLNDSLVIASNLCFSYMVIDGDKVNRRHMAAACSHGARTAGISVQVLASGCEYIGNAFVNAVCGAALATTGSGILIQNNLFRSNGDFNNITLAYADGISMAVSEGSKIAENHFEDWTRSGIALGGGAALQVQDNTFNQRTTRSFAAITLDTLHGPHGSEFWGAVITKNKIDCGDALCLFGLLLGSKPFSTSSAPIVGGDAHENTITGAVVLINVNDANNWTLYGNKYDSPRGHFSHCTKKSTQLNISPASQVNRHGESSPTALTESYANCIPPA